MKDIKLSPERGVGQSGSCIFPAFVYVALNSRGGMKDIKLSPEKGVGKSGSCALLITCFIVVSERSRMISSRMVRIHLVIGCFNVLCFGQGIPQGNYPWWSRSCQLSRRTETANFFPFAWLFAPESPGSWSNDIRTILHTSSDQNVSTYIRFVFSQSIGDLQIVTTVIKGPQRLQPFSRQRKGKTFKSRAFPSCFDMS